MGHSSGVGQSQCTACEAGFYAEEEASTQCTKAAAGAYVAEAGSSAATPCPVGAFSLPGQAECTPCDEGTYAAAEGSPFCTSCTTVSAGAWTPTAGSELCTSCKPQFYFDTRHTNPDGSVGGCAECAEGMRCGDGQVLETLNLNDQYWRMQPWNTELRLCSPIGCKGGNAYDNTTGLFDADNYCLEGYVQEERCSCCCC